uniref:Uncharacterized protein n=1 Tax=Cacopsylla melanoneura TaxID=428564 RepID=A0A8D8QNG2_9HEMI
MCTNPSTILIITKEQILTILEVATVVRTPEDMTLILGGMAPLLEGMDYHSQRHIRAIHTTLTDQHCPRSIITLLSFILKLNPLLFQIIILCMMFLLLKYPQSAVIRVVVERSQSV